MILLDTHIWIWWVSKSARLQSKHRELLENQTGRPFGVSIISCWEIAKLVEYGRLQLDRAVEEWVAHALTESSVELIPLSARMAVESTQLPQPFHRDPADQILVATARVLKCPLMTEDARIMAYPHVLHA